MESCESVSVLNLQGFECSLFSTRMVGLALLNENCICDDCDDVTTNLCVDLLFVVK